MTETAAQRALAARNDLIAAELRRQARALDALANRLDPIDVEVGGVPLEGVASPGAVLVVRERLRQVEDEGHDLASDHVYVGNELAWAAFCYLERAAQDRLPQDDPSVPHVWPLGRGEWKPKESRVRNLVIGAALVVAEIDRLIDRGERP